MHLTIHYFAETGEIFAFESGDAAIAQSWREDCELVHVKYDGDVADLAARLYKVAGGKLVRKSRAQIKKLYQPTEREISEAVANELRGSDQFVVPDRPMAENERQAWRDYRQALRDISKRSTATAMVAAWPTRPDGGDAIAELRARMRK